MSQLSTLALLLRQPASFYERKFTQQEYGSRGGAILRERKARRIEAIRPRMIEMLRNYRSYAEMAQTVGVSRLTIQNYIKGDPEFRKLASLYIKSGGYRKRKSV